MGFLSNTPENRKSVNKNPKSYFTKSLQNAKAQIILSEDCSNSVLQTGREGTWLFEESGLLGSIPGGEAGGTHWNPRRDSGAQRSRHVGVQQVLPNPQMGRGLGTHGRSAVALKTGDSVRVWRS